MVVEKPANYDQPQTVNDELLIPAQVGQEVQLEPGTDEAINIEMTEDGGAVVNPEQEQIETGFDGNLAEFMDPDVLTNISSELRQSYEDDKGSRQQWEEAYTKGLDLLGLNYNERSQPFQGASGVTHPLLAESVTQFQAQAYKELLPAAGPVRAQVIGLATKEKEDQAQRVAEFMNYQMMHVMEEYDPELDQMLFYLPLSGSTFKKVYYDSNLGRAVSKFVPSEDLVVPYSATNLEECERVTHVLKRTENDIKKMQVTGFYRDIPLQPSEEDQNKVEEKERKLSGIEKNAYKDDQYTLLEMHVDLDIEGFEHPDGIKLPYIVTIDEGSSEVLSVYRNYSQEDSLYKKQQYFVHYKFMPGLGFYGLGLIHTIGGLSRTATAALRQLIDAGTLSNLPAGFKARGLRIRDDDDPLQPGEFRDVDAPGGAIRDSLMPLPFKGPDATLFNLLGFVVQAGQRFATITDMKVGDGNQQAAVGTTVAMLEQGARVMSAVHKRMHYAMKQEFKLLVRVMSESLPQEYPFTVAGGQETIMAADFDDRVDVIPVSNPNIFSQAQRIALAQTQMQLAAQAPDLHDTYEAFRRMYEALGVRDIDKILKPKVETEKTPTDPAQENINALEQMQLRAFPEQNHDAHVIAHLTFGASAIVQQAPGVAVNLQKHVLEHLKLKAEERAMAEVQKLAPGQQMNADLEGMMQGLVAQFIAEELQAVRQLSMTIAAGGENKPDPLIGLKEKELQIRQQQVQANIAQDQAELQLDREKAAERAREFNARLQQQAELADDKLRASREREIMRLQTQLQTRRQ